MPSNSAFNWTCKNLVSYKVKYTMEEEKDILYTINSKNELRMNNTRHFYGINMTSDIFIEKYNSIINEDNKDVLLFLINLKYILIN